VFDLHHPVIINKHVIVVNVLPSLSLLSFLEVYSSSASVPLFVLSIFADAIEGLLATFNSSNFFLFALKFKIVVLNFLIESFFKQLLRASVSEVLIGYEGYMVLINSTFAVFTRHL